MLEKKKKNYDMKAFIQTKLKKLGRVNSLLSCNQQTMTTTVAE